MKRAKWIVLILLTTAAAIAIAVFINGSFKSPSAEAARPGDQQIPSGAVPEATAEHSKSGTGVESGPADITTSTGAALAALAGRWVNAGGDCHSGETFLLDASGEYFDEGSTGNWKLSGDRLSITTADIEHAGLGPSETGTTPRTTVLTLMDVTSDSMTWSDDEGRKNKFSRCP